MQRARILAVDDDPLNLAILEELFAEEYNLTTAENGQEALRIAEQIRPDLILLDIMMPGIDGYEVCRQVRSRDTLKYTKVLLVSAKAMTSERLKGYDAGADDYIIKPFDHAELGAKIQVFLRLKSMEETNEIKTQFLTLLAHETRTPLHQITMLAEMLGGEDGPEGSQREELVGMLQAATTRLGDLLERGHRLCQLRAGQVAFRPEPLDLAALLRGVIAGAGGEGRPAGAGFLDRGPPLGSPAERQGRACARPWCW